MYVLAARSQMLPVWLATGQLPLTSPPVTASSFDGLSGDLVYVCLHGVAGQPYWYGDDMVTAVTAKQVRASDLSGATVYLAGCFGRGPMSDALLAAGAAYVVGDSDAAWAGRLWPTGSNALGKYFLHWHRRGWPAVGSLEQAKLMYRRYHIDKPTLLERLARRYFGVTEAMHHELLASVQLLGDPGARL